jgi:hypothetical protein
MQFVIDETSWRFTGLVPVKCIEALESMLDRVDDINDEGHTICYSDALFNMPVWEDKIFYALYSPECALFIPREVQERIAITFNTLLKWQDIDSEDPTSCVIQIEGESAEVAPSIAWAHKQTMNDRLRPVGCVVFPGGRSSGLRSVIVNEKSTSLWFISDQKEYSYCFRWLITSTTTNHNEMKTIAPSAFPSLDFADGAFEGIKRMTKPYRDIVDTLVQHLGVLSDDGQRIFQGRRQSVVAEFGALGVNISDENGNTKSDRLARRARTIEVNGVETLFWWHTKIEPHQNRIHLNPDSAGHGGRLLIGIFCDHLK